MRQPRVLHTLCSPACGPARGGPGAGKWGCAVPGDRVLRLPMDTGGAARRTSTQPSPRSPTRVPADAAAEHDVCRKAPPPPVSRPGSPPVGGPRGQTRVSRMQGGRCGRGQDSPPSRSRQDQSCWVSVGCKRRSCLSRRWWLEGQGRCPLGRGAGVQPGPTGSLSLLSLPPRGRGGRWTIPPSP